MLFVRIDTMGYDGFFSRAVGDVEAYTGGVAHPKIVHGGESVSYFHEFCCSCCFSNIFYFFTTRNFWIF